MTTRCSECPLNGYIKVKDKGDKNADIIFIGESPGKEENIKELCFVGPSGQLMDEYIRTLELNKYKIAFVNAAKCTLNKKEKKSTNQALACCRDRIVKIVQKVKPKLLVTLGGIASKQILGIEKVLENTGKCVFSEEFQCHVLMTTHPSYVLRNGGIQSPQGVAMGENLAMIHALFENAFKIPTRDFSNYRLVKDKDLKEFLDKEFVAIDFETTGTSPIDGDRVLSIALCSEPGKAVCLFTKENKTLSNFKAIVQNEKIRKIVAFRPFDENFSKIYLGIPWYGPIYDICTMAHLYNENLEAYNLEYLCDLFTPLKHIKEVAEGQRTTLSEAPKELLKNYNCIDADGTLRTFNTLKVKLKKEKKLSRYYLNFLCKVQNTFSKIALNGVTIDKEKLEVNKQKVQELQSDLYRKAIALLPQKLIEKHTVKGEAPRLTKTRMVLEFLFESRRNGGLGLTPVMFTDKTKNLSPNERVPSSSAKHLITFKNIPFVDLYLQWKKLDKISSTYFGQIENNIKKDGRVYPTVLFTTTVTGRTTVSDPPMQVIPKRHPHAHFIRDLFVADDDWDFISFDLSQSEIRVIAWIAHAESILDALWNGIDIHRLTASKILEKPIDKVTSSDRDRAKPVNFGLIYGASANGLREYAKNEYGVEFTQQEAEEYVKGYFRSYPELLGYHRRQKEFCSKYGYVVSPLGRRRRLPDIYSDDIGIKSRAIRQAINHPVQSFSNDLALLIMSLLQEKLEQDKKTDLCRLLWFIHDEIVLMRHKSVHDYIIETTMEIAEKKSKEYIKKNFGIDVAYPIKMDYKIGHRWSEMKEPIKEETP